MRVLVGCESSGVVRDAFIARGHDAWSCDPAPQHGGLLPSGPHLQCDVLTVLNDGWDLGIFFPDCTFLTVSGLHWNSRVSGRADETAKALDFVRRLLSAPIRKIALENPRGCISTQIKPHTQIIQPYQFGHDASKETFLWLKNLMPLVPTKIIEPRWINGRPRWANQMDDGQNRLAQTDDRARLRGLTYPGIAQAMAEQWG